MRSRLIRIGNSRGLRLSKPLLEQAGLTDEVEITIERGAVVIRAAVAPRAGWAESIQKHGPSEMLYEPFPNKFDEEEWVW